MPPDFRPRNDYPSMLDAALDYIRMGLEVVPVHSPLMLRKSGVARHGEKVAAFTGKVPLRFRFLWRGLRTEMEVRYWFTRYPKANIAIRTGKKTGIAVLDVDYYKNAQTALTQLRLPPTLRTQSGGGEHLYFLYPDASFDCVTLNDGILGTLTLLASHSLATAPPSLHANGNRYRWINPEMPMAKLDGELLALARAQENREPRRLIWLYLRSRCLLFIMRVLPFRIFAIAKKCVRKKT